MCRCACGDGRAAGFAVALSLLIVPGTTWAQSSCTAPAITGQPAVQMVCPGESAGFSVAASGSGPLSYQWRRGITPLTNGGNIAGATSGTLTINPVSGSDADGTYNCVVSNACGTATSNNALLAVSSAVNTAARRASRC